MMATRSGAIDPGLLLYLLQSGHMPVSGVEDLLYRKSGLLGVSGASTDMRTLLASSDAKARQAVDQFCARAAEQVAVMGDKHWRHRCAGLHWRHWRKQPRDTPRYLRAPGMDRVATRRQRQCAKPRRDLGAGEPDRSPDHSDRRRSHDRAAYARRCFVRGWLAAQCEQGILSPSLTFDLNLPAQGLEMPSISALSKPTGSDICGAWPSSGNSTSLAPGMAFAAALPNTG